MQLARLRRLWPGQAYGQRARPLHFSVAIMFCAALSGCAALSNPVANGLPVRRLPPAISGEPKSDQKTIPLTLLRQKPPDFYRLAPGDVLAVWIEGVLGERTQLPPASFTGTGNLLPALGHPVPVNENGTLTLPLVEAIRVQGLSLEEAQKAVRKAYTVDQKIVQPGRDRIIVTLLKPRQYHVLVVRQDSVGPGGAAGGGGAGSTRAVSFSFGTSGGGSSRRGAGFAIDLPAYENDVLHALTLTGGLPGLDAINEVVIERGYFQDQTDQSALMQSLEALPPGSSPVLAMAAGHQVIKIPLRARPGELPFIKPEDIILQTGDIVFVEARDPEFFYTGGLLPPGAYPLPRDYDLDVLAAIVQVGGPVAASGVNPNNINGAISTSGLGSPSPSLVSIVRRTPGHEQMVIRVDLNRALNDSHERILIQPGDVIILQETSGEAIARYVSQVLNINLFWQFLHGPHESGTGTVTVPQ